MIGRIGKAVMLVVVVSLVSAGLAFASPSGDAPGRAAAGTVASVGSRSFDLRTRSGEVLTFQVDDETAFRSHDGSVIGLEDLQEGMAALVRYLPGDEERLIARLVVIVPDAESRPELMRAAGEITQVIPGRSVFSLASQDGREFTFKVSERTRFRSEDGSVEDIHDLKKGMYAQVVAAEQQDGTLLALLVAVGFDLDPEKMRAAGKITAVYPGRSAFDLHTQGGHDLTILVNERTQYRSPDGSIEGLEDLEPGMLAYVEAWKLKDGVLLAQLVAAGSKDDLPKPIHVRGEITQVIPGQSTFFLMSGEGEAWTIGVTERTRFRSHDGSVEDIHDLKKGMQASVVGLAADGGSLTALLVAVLGDGSGQPQPIRASGEISAVNPGQSTFALISSDGRELEFEVVERTRFRSSDGSVQDLKDLKKGMQATVAGIKKGDGSLVALLVVVGDPGGSGRRPSGPDTTVAGRVTALDANSLTFAARSGESVSLVVSAETVFRSPDGSVSGLEDLEVGMLAAAGAIEQADGSWKALWVAAGNGNGQERRPSGEGQADPQGSRDSGRD